MSEEFHRRRVQPLMYNYIQEVKYFRRNAAIAMGNSGDPAFIPTLARAVKDPRGAGAGLRRLGPGKERRIKE